MATRVQSFVAFSYNAGVVRILYFYQFHTLQTKREDKQERHLFDLSILLS